MANKIIKIIKGGKAQPQPQIQNACEETPSTLVSDDKKKTRKIAKNISNWIEEYRERKTLVHLAALAQLNETFSSAK